MSECVGGTCRTGETVQVMGPQGRLVDAVVVSKTGHSAVVQDPCTGLTSTERQDQIYKKEPS